MSCEQWDSVSSFFSTLSLVSWIGAQLPQIYANYANKSADGISPSFLMLWFLGDFLSFTSCLLNDAVLRFQIYLSVFFLMNDVTLCCQYYYYTSVYPRRAFESVAGERAPQAVVDIDAYEHSDAMAIRHSRDPPSSSSDSTPSSYDSTGASKPLRAAAAASFVGSANAMSYKRGSSGTETLGLVLAWGCTFVYMFSRCPQLLKNYRRKSVNGISPILFGAALVGNLTYTLSILTSCAFASGEPGFFVKELPYILGSSGTVVFDALYFYQRHLYRDAGRNTSAMALENWE